MGCKVKEIEREETDGVLTTEDFDELENFDVPATFAIMLFVIWMMLWSGIFTVAFDWSFWKSFYFLFITNTTIGLGDIVPPTAIRGLLVLPILLVSLAFISMMISVISNTVEEGLEDAVFEDVLGWDTDTSEEEDEAKKAEKRRIREQKQRQIENGGKPVAVVGGGQAAKPKNQKTYGVLLQ